VTRTLHCLAFGDANGWQAYCLDLDIAVEGRSFPEAEARLREAVRDYVEVAMALPEAERAPLLDRRMPFLTRLRFVATAFLGLVDAILPGGGRGSYRHQYTMPTPACA
jgi:hypothetical protein